jgi:hypothetical protein
VIAAVVVLSRPPRQQIRLPQKTRTSYHKGVQTPAERFSDAGAKF